MKRFILTIFLLLSNIIIIYHDLCSPSPAPKNHYINQILPNIYIYIYITSIFYCTIFFYKMNENINIYITYLIIYNKHCVFAWIILIYMKIIMLLNTMLIMNFIYIYITLNIWFATKFLVLYFLSGIIFPNLLIVIFIHIYNMKAYKSYLMDYI